MAKIYVNGDVQEVALPLNVSELIRQNNVQQPEMVSVQVNEAFADASDWDGIQLNEGDKVDIWAYFNNADEVELFVNGKSYGRDGKEGAKLHAQWNQVPFEPGKIEVVSYKDGKVVARESRETTGKPVALKLTADRSTINADGYDLSYITIEAVDDKGRAVPTADLMLNYSVSGAGELFGVDNGNPADTLSLKGDKKALFSGKALGVVRSFKGIPGTARLTVDSEVGSAHIDIKVK